MICAIAILQQQLFLGVIQLLMVDRGNEFAPHASIIQALGIPLYFADSFATWQRERNEHRRLLLTRILTPQKKQFRDYIGCTTHCSAVCDKPSPTQMLVKGISTGFIYTYVGAFELTIRLTKNISNNGERSLFDFQVNERQIDSNKP